MLVILVVKVYISIYGWGHLPALTLCVSLRGGGLVESNNKYIMSVYVDIYLCMVVNDCMCIYYIWRCVITIKDVIS